MSDESEHESSGKKSIGGHLAVALAGLGALFARTADDCGRVAIKGASLSDDALRGGAKVGALADDGLRGGSKLGSLADDGLRAGKYAPLALTICVIALPVMSLAPVPLESVACCSLASTVAEAPRTPV